MSVYQRKGSKVYYFDFWHKGTRFHGTTEESTERAAKAVEKRIKDKVRAESKPRPAQGMTFDIAASRYWDEVAMHKISAAEIHSNLERLIPMVGEDTLLTSIDDEMLSKLVALRRAAKRWGREGEGARFVTPATVNRQVTQLLRPIMLRARKVWKVQLPDMPDWGSHILREPKERVRELREHEEEAIEAVERSDYVAIRRFAQITGLRLREVVGLTWGQVDLRDGTINVVGKGDRPHVVPMTAEVLEILEPLRGHHPENVFTFVAVRTYTNHKAGRSYVQGQRYPMTYHGLSTRRKRTFEKAAIKDLRWHDLRHTAATRIVRETGNLKVAQKMLGHSDLRTTGRYAHADQNDVREAMERSSSRYRKKAASPTENPTKVDDVE